MIIFGRQKQILEYKSDIVVVSCYSKNVNS